MIKIAIKLTVIALVFVGFIFMAIVVIRCDKSNHFKPSNMYYYDDYKHVFSKKGSAHTIILGNSKVLSSLSAKVIQGVSGRLTISTP